MQVGGSGTVAFYDPFVVDMDNNHNFTLEQNNAGSVLLMSGTNLVTTDGGVSTINLKDGVTQVTSASGQYNDFTMVFGAGTQADILFGSDHTLTILNLPNRDNTLPLFDLTNITGNGNKFVVENGSTLDITRLLKPLEDNRYLLVSGLDPSDTVTVGQFMYLHPDGYTKQPVFENNNTEIWLDDIVVTDAFDPDVVDPNVVAGENCLTTWLNQIAPGLSLTPQQVLDLRADFASATPEAALTLVNIGLDVHFMAAESANRAAFGLAGGSWGGLDQAGAATGSIIAGFSPVNNATRSAVAGADGAWAQLASDQSGRRGLRFWSGYMGGYDRSKKYDGYSGYHADTHGFLMGMVWDVDDFVSFGAYGGYSKTDTDFRSIHADAKTDAGHFGLHAAFKSVNGFKAVFDASFSHTSNSLKRTPAGLTPTKGHISQDIVGGGAHLMYDIELSPMTRLTPMASFNGAWIRQKAFDETGPYLAAHVKKVSDSSFQSVLGATIAHDAVLGERAVLTASLGAGWKHIYGGNQFSTRYYFLDNFAAGFVSGGCKVTSRERGRDSALIGAAIDTLFQTKGGTQWGLKAGYNFEVGRKRTNHSTFFGAELRF